MLKFFIHKLLCHSWFKMNYWWASWNFCWLVVFFQLNNNFASHKSIEFTACLTSLSWKIKQIVVKQLPLRITMFAILHVNFTFFCILKQFYWRYPIKYQIYTIIHIFILTQQLCKENNVYRNFRKSLVKWKLTLTSYHSYHYTFYKSLRFATFFLTLTTSCY